MKRNNKNKFNTDPFVIHGVIDAYIDNGPYAMQSLDIFEDLINEDLVDARG